MKRGRGLTMGRILRTLVLFLFALPALAAEITPPLLHLDLDVWSRADGLPQNSVWALLRSSDGYLWIGTESGLARFDGVRFVSFDSKNTPALRSDLVTALFESRDGTLWIGTHGALLRMRDERFESIPLNGLEDDTVNDIAEDAEGRLWVVTGHDTAVLRDGRLSPLPLEPRWARGAARLLPTGDGDVWIVSAGMARIREGVIESYEAGAEMAVSPASVVEDAEGVLWIGTSDGRLGTFRDGRFVDARSGKRFPGPVLALAFDSAGALWVGGTGGGIHRLRDGRLESLTSGDGLRNDDVVSIVPDGDGSIWFGTAGGGLHRLRENAVTTLSTREGLSHPNVLCVFEDRRGALWAGVSGGELNRISDAGVEPFGAARGLDENAVLAIAEGPEALWFGTGGAGLFRFDGSRFRHVGVARGETGAIVMAILVARDGTVFLGSEQGLRRQEADRFVDVPIPAPDGRRRALFVVALAEDDDGTLWVGTQGDGLFRVSRGPSGLEAEDAGIGSALVLALRTEPDGTVWVGTGGEGLLRLRRGTVERFREADGLVEDMVFSIQADDQGRLWLSGNAGITRVDRQAIDAFAEGLAPKIVTTLYSTAEGLRAGECSGGGQNTGIRRRDGRIAFATPDGVASIDPASLPGSRVAPRAIIESITCDGEGIPLAAGTRAASIPGGSRQCEIAYTGVPLADAEGLQFRYRLQGLDDGWVDAGTRRTAYYTHLGPGDFSFEVSVRNHEMVRNTETTVLSLRVERRFHETWWFFAGCLAAAVGVGLGSYRVGLRRFHARQARLREAERMAIYGTLVAGVAHEVRHPIFAIQMAAYVLQQRLAGSPDLETQLRVLDRETRRMTVLTDDLLEFARPAELVRTPTSVAEMLAEAVESFQVEHPEATAAIEVDVPEGLRAVDVDRARFVQIVVNLMENAHKHAEGLTRIGMAARVEDGLLQLSVVNDGSTIPLDALPRLFEPFFTTGRGTGLGLAIVKRIVEEHGGTIDVRSANQEGTRVTLCVPAAVSDT